MMDQKSFSYIPADGEAEQASNSYLMSLVALIVGLPLPILNLIATLIFFTANRNKSYFVRWHCTQALLSQVSLLLVNSFAFWWTFSIFFEGKELSNPYFAYILTVLLFNLIEFAATIYTAIETRKGNHVSWWVAGSLTQVICKPKMERI
jgi:uncharacterized Tic20 family protein